MNMFEPEPIEPSEFQTTLTVEHDIILVKASTSLYHIPGMRCDPCGVVDKMVYAPTFDSLMYAMEAADSMVAGIDLDEFTDDDPRDGFFVCLDCGDGIGADLSDADIRVLDLDSWNQYAEFRIESGDPV